MFEYIVMRKITTKIVHTLLVLEILCIWCDFQSIPIYGYQAYVCN